MELDRKVFFQKTEIQKRIEANVSNERNYQRVPYLKLFGQKIALRQWLRFSRARCINEYTNPSDKTYFLDYLPIFIEFEKREFKKNLPLFIISYSRDLDREK